MQDDIGLGLGPLLDEEIVLGNRLDLTYGDIPLDQVTRCNTAARVAES